MSGKLPVPYVDQSKSDVEGDQVAGSKYTAKAINIYGAGKGASVVDKLLVSLQEEMARNEKCSELIAKLQRYHGGLTVDGVKGLEAKLARANRGDELAIATDSKEQFAMLLERWSYYASAQEILVYLLARTEQRFNSEIKPLIPVLSEAEINQKFNALIVDPTVEDCGATVFNIDHMTAMGMIYWLAEQCFVRWH